MYEEKWNNLEGRDLAGNVAHWIAPNETLLVPWEKGPLSILGPLQKGGADYIRGE